MAPRACSKRSNYFAELEPPLRNRTVDLLLTMGLTNGWPTPTTQSPATRLADLLAERGDLDELRARVDAGDSSAATRLADSGHW